VGADSTRRCGTIPTGQQRLRIDAVAEVGGDSKNFIVAKAGGLTANFTMKSGSLLGE
jgi:hypothetical protein